MSLLLDNMRDVSKRNPRARVNPVVFCLAGMLYHFAIIYYKPCR